MSSDLLPPPPRPLASAWDPHPSKFRIFRAVSAGSAEEDPVLAAAGELLALVVGVAQEEEQNLRAP